MPKSLAIAQLDRTISRFQDDVTPSTVGAGWIATVRKAIGMSTAQLAARMGIERSGLAHHQRRERAGTITLQSLTRVADALGCDVVYAFVPRAGSYQAMIAAQARRAAEQQLAEVGHSMALEDQNVDPVEYRRQVDALTAQLAREHPVWIWDVS